tara:strand:- start:45 stop:530 length:486 start_codon:yes stop_codon:yes gene_type:complete
MFKHKKESYLKVIFSLSFISVVSAYYIEYVLGHQPCNLCLIERIPYILSLIIIIINFKFSKYEKFLIIILIILFSFSFLISLYHFGIEKGFVEESLFCNLKNSTDILTKEQLLIELQKKMVSCKDVTFRIFGFSLTGINIVLSLILTILSIQTLILYEKIK